MKDANDLLITASSDKLLNLVNEASEIIIRKKSGLDKLLLEETLPQDDYPILTIYQALQYFMSFSDKTIKAKFPTLIARLEANVLNTREQMYLQTLHFIHLNELVKATENFSLITAKFPKDRVAIVLLSICAFVSGQLQLLAKPLERLLPLHRYDADFLGTVAFFYCHVNKKTEARQLLEAGLKIDPSNAWLQHVMFHTIDESKIESVNYYIQLLSNRADDWPAHDRFFESHNWMHVCNLYLAAHSHLNEILPIYKKHIWGSAKSMLFEQNNAFIVLWLLELAGHKIDRAFWSDLAAHAKAFADDYFVPYFTVTSILAVMRVDQNQGQRYHAKLQQYVTALPQTALRQTWEQLALPILEGCHAYIQADYAKAKQKLVGIADLITTRPMGLSDEQRSVFAATADFCMKKA
ncbi:MAG: hypothetical protein AAGG80_00125 [Pseudomonadota bacterium]